MEAHGRARGVRIALAVALVALSGCSVPVAANLDESDANQAVVLLDRGGVGAAKERDPEHEGKWRVSVPDGDASAAIAVLAEENLPARPSPGVLEALHDGSVVPSRLAEEAKLTAGVAGDLERSLRTVDGVLSARVHVAIPSRDALAPEETPERPSAAVLVRHRGATPPLAPEAVQRLVAGAVPGLVPERVSVVMAVSPVSHGAQRELVRIGPLSVTRGSASALRWLLALAIGLNLALIAAVAALWARLRRSELGRGELGREAPVASEARR